MLVKCTMIFSLTTNLSNATTAGHRTGGWTEGYYWNSGGIDACKDKFMFGVQNAGQSLCGFRARLLPTGAAITGQRFQLLNPLAASQSLNKPFLGASGIGCDVPQMALLCKVPGVNVSNARMLTLRAIPDARVVEGEYKPSDAFAAALRDFLDALGAFAFRAKDLTLPKKKILSITNQGVIVWEQFGPDAAVGDLITISATKNVARVTIKRKVKVLTLANNGTVASVEPWTDGYCTGGTAVGVSTIYPTMDGVNATVGRIVVRKVGRPIGGYVGRHSKKKSA